MTETTETGGRIKQQAHLLFMQYGLRSVSMDDIANALGISKKTVYRFYEDKDALVDDVIASVILHNQECCEKDRAIAENAVHEVFLALDFMMEIFRSMNPALVYDMQKYYPRAFQKFSTHKHDYLFTVIKENISRGIAEGLYREDLQTEVIARFRVDSMMLPFNPEFFTKLKQSLAALEEEITLHFLFGLVSAKGYKLATKYHEARLKKLTQTAKDSKEK